MIKVFDKLSEYYSYVNGGLNSGDIYFVTEDESAHFQTNNIDGELKVYDLVSEDAIPGDSESDVVAVFVDASFTENGVYDPADYNADGFASVTVSVPVPDGYVLPSGNLNITSNASSINVANYETVSVSVAAPAPSLSWNTLSGDNLEMNVGTTYVFKTNVDGVYMRYGGVDIDVDGDIDADDESYVLGKMVANTEYYFTALNEFAGSFDGGTHSYMHFGGDSYGGGATLPAGVVIQYAVLS